MKFKNSKIIIGGAQFGNPYGINNPKKKKLSRHKISTILNYSFKNNINTLDTAINYGDSENQIFEHISKNNRQKWNVITKINSSSIKDLHKSFDKFKKCELSILAHSYKDLKSEKVRKEILYAKKHSLAKKIGVSIYTDSELNKILKYNFNIDIIQLPLHILNLNSKKLILIDRLYKKGYEIHARSIFLQGLFFLSPSKLKNKFKKFLDFKNKIDPLCKYYKTNLAEISLRKILSLNQIDKLVIGVDSISQLKKNLIILKKKNDLNLLTKIDQYKFFDSYTFDPRKWSQ